MKLDNCPSGCGHKSFHYCVRGTHCDKHCVCPCHMCKGAPGVGVGTEVLVVHNNELHDGRVAEGPTFAGQYRIIVPALRDSFGWYKDASQFRVKRSNVEVPEHHTALAEVADLQRRVNQGGAS